MDAGLICIQSATEPAWNGQYHGHSAGLPIATSIQSRSRRSVGKSTLIP